MDAALGRRLISNVAVDPTNPNRLALITQQDPYKDYCDSTGVWVSADGGQTWAQAMPDWASCAARWSPSTRSIRPVWSAARRDAAFL